jgi:hypothetical protein
VARLVVGISRALGVIAALAIVVLMIAIVIDVTTRYLTGSSMPAMVELSESALIVSLFFGLAWAGGPRGPGGGGRGAAARGGGRRPPRAAAARGAAPSATS